MCRRLATLSIALALSVCQSLVAAQPSGSNVDLAAGIRQLEEGDLDEAVVTLDAVVKRLKAAPGNARDLALAHLYLGMAHLGLSQWERAKAEMREAWRNDKNMKLDPKKFSPRVRQAYEEAKAEGEASTRSAGDPADDAGAAGRAPAPPVQGVTIDHRKVDCVVAGKHPRMSACFSPASDVARKRVYFRPEEASVWYYVEMTGTAPCFEGVLPKPSKKLVGKRVFYYVEVTDKSFSVGRTVENESMIVGAAPDCTTAAVAPFYGAAKVAVLPGMPAGFLGGAGIPTIGLVGAGVVAAGGAAAAVTMRGDGGAPPTSPTTMTATMPPIITPSPTTTPPTTPLAELTVSCSATPRSGEVPLRVSFESFPAGGTGVYEYLWRFGDGATSSQPSPTYTYGSPGAFVASVDVTSGPDVVHCERSITVTPPPTNPPTGTFTLKGLRRMKWSSTLTVPGGKGQVTLNSSFSLQPGEGVVEVMTDAQQQNQVQAKLTSSNGRPGIWRFQFDGEPGQGRFRQGSLRGVSGTVVLLNSNTIAFAMSGRAGEAVAFTFETR